MAARATEPTFPYANRMVLFANQSAVALQTVATCTTRPPAPRRQRPDDSELYICLLFHYDYGERKLG